MSRKDDLVTKKLEELKSQMSDDNLVKLVDEIIEAVNGPEPPVDNEKVVKVGPK